jgi:hypothetical protein
MHQDPIFDWQANHSAILVPGGSTGCCKTEEDFNED